MLLWGKTEPKHLEFILYICQQCTYVVNSCTCVCVCVCVWANNHTDRSIAVFYFSVNLQTLFFPAIIYYLGNYGYLNASTSNKDFVFFFTHSHTHTHNIPQEEKKKKLAKSIYNKDQ